MKSAFRLTVLASALVMAGCVTEKTTKVETDIQSQGNQAMSEIKNIKVPAKKSQVFSEDHAWIPSTTTQIEKSVSWLHGDKEIALSRNFVDFVDFAGRVSSLTGVKINLAQEIFETTEETTSSSVDTGFNIDYEGNVSGLLDAATSKAGLYWNVNPDNSVSVARFDSKTWRISALIGNVTQTNAVKNGESNSSFDVSGASIWSSFDDGIKSLLSEKGQVFVSESLGTVTVKDTPAVLAVVDRFVKQQNKSLSKSVLVNIKIYVVKMNDSEDYGIDWNLLYNSINTTQTGLAASLINTAIAPTGNSKLSLGIIGSNSEFSGSKLLLQALSTRGQVSEVRDTRQLTLNGQPVPFKEGKEIAYLKSSETTISNGIASTSSEQGLLNTGFFLNVVPHVLDDGQELLLQVALNMTTLDRMNSITSGTSTIQIPETSSREMIQRVKLRTEDTLVITGFDASDLNSTLGGVGSPDNTWLGGSASSGNGRTMMVVLVQPIVSND